MYQLRVFVIMALVLGLLVSVGITPRSALADVATVSGADCDRDGLADTIAAAASGDTVTFDCNPAEIDFASDDTITITKTITIDGSNGGNQIVLDGNDVTNFFMVDTGGDLTLQHLTMQHGYALNGGAVYVNNTGTSTVIAATFIENQATYGGAIGSAHTLTITQSKCINNQATLFGGAIHVDGTLTVSQSSFTGNSAVYDGGALNTALEPVRVVASTFSGNIAGISGSTLHIHWASNTTEIAWSTISQPANTTSALNINYNLTLTGVILGGEGGHCQVNGGTLTDSYTLANDDSCGLSGTGSVESISYSDGLSNLGLDVLTSATINGVVQSYFPPIASPALNGGPSTCDSGIMSNSDPEPDQLGNPRPSGTYCDIGAIERIIISPTTLCVNQWNGSLRVNNDCNRSDTQITIPQDGPITLCVNDWDGTARASDRCTRSEHQITAIGDNTIPTCINTWNSTLRVSDQCTRSEHPHLL